MERTELVDLPQPNVLPGEARTPRSPALGDRTAWRDASLAWLAQHLVYLVVAYLALTLLRPNAATTTAPLSWLALLAPWTG